MTLHYRAFNREGQTISLPSFLRATLSDFALSLDNSSIFVLRKNCCASNAPFSISYAIAKMLKSGSAALIKEGIKFFLHKWHFLRVLLQCEEADYTLQHDQYDRENLF